MHEIDELAVFTAKNIEENVTIISTAGGSAHMYLIRGEKVDTLIDTGYGHGDLAAFLKGITSNDIAVINTHGHLDHVGANDSFPLVYQAKNAESDYSAGFGVTVNNISKKMIVSGGDRLSIDSNEFEIIDCESHSHSDIAILDKKRRLLFAGDVIDSDQVLLVGYNDETENYLERVSMHIKAMERLIAKENDFDYIYPAHNRIPVEKSFLFEIIELDKEILKGTEKIYPLNHKYMELSEDAPYFRRTIKGNCSVVYRIKKERK